MIPAEFDYFAPSSVKEATELLQREPRAKVLAGGMSLIPAMKHRLAQPSAIVDIGRIDGLDGVAERRGRLTFGGRVTHARIGAASELASFPIFAEAAAEIGDAQVRNRGTLGGSLVHADPAADWSAVFLALDGEARVVGPRGERTIAAADFFAGMLTSALHHDEILTEVQMTCERGRAGAAYAKMRQPASGFAIVGVAAELVLDRRGRCEKAAIAITGTNPVPFRAASIEARLRGETLDAGSLARLCDPIEELEPMEDLHASAEYRRHLASVYARRALVGALSRAGA
ncbi:MAG: xanthine dehydrogenase family protein subunit M [Myxococcota bacterium]